LKYFSNFFTSKAIIAYFSVLMICAWLFAPSFLPFIWMGFGILAVFSFFYFSSVLTLRWVDLSQVRFQKNIFVTALIVRLIYVILIYFFYQAQTGAPFEFFAGDSIGYHGEANYILQLFFSGNINYYFFHYLKGVSDSGWPIIMAFIYLFTFKSIFILRLINALVSAWMVVLIYRISQRNFGERAARITAVLAMLLPAFIYYSGLHLKETFMVFFLIAFINQADYLLHSRNFSIRNILLIVFLGTSLFFFRTVLAAAAWFTLLSAFLLSSDKLMSNYRKVVIIGWLVIAAAFVFSGKILNEVSGYLGARKTNQETRYEFFSTREGANTLSKYGSAAIFIPLIIPAPFPTLVNIPEQKNQMMTNGDLFTRNVYVFFVFIAFWELYKKKRIRSTLLLSVFLGTYLLILANSGFALSPRFHVPALPFLLMFAGYGITQTNRNYSSYYVLYLIAISIVVIGWNWFKLAGRGMV
jgi:4-amino-4-deoxy-L-arabinose transferase-like glycosyltransferase